MEWTEASIYTSTEGVELLCGKLLELGINGFAVEDAQDFEAFLEETTPHWDYVDDSLMALKDAETRVIVYLPKNVQGAQTLAAVSSVVRALKADDAEGRMGRLEIDHQWKNRKRSGEIAGNSRIFNQLSQRHTAVRTAGRQTQSGRMHRKFPGFRNDIYGVLLVKAFF